MPQFSIVVIIYNPKSTGPSKRNALSLYRYLKTRVPNQRIETWQTEQAGHAEKLAKQAANKYSRPLIISSSGDGGYNEVINGVLSSNNTQAVCAVLPSGNANDHARALQTAPLKKLVTTKEPTKIDLFEVKVETAGKTTTRYAHSYVGMGLTPEVAKELNNNKLTPSKEMWITLKTFWNYNPEPIAKQGHATIQSFMCGNIPHFAKRLTIHKGAKPNDGSFELWLITKASKAELLRELAKAAFKRLETPKPRKTFTFTVIKDSPIQFDGEVLELKAGAKVAIRIKHRALETFI